MEMITINETPVRTSQNFQMNHIKIEENSIPKQIKPFQQLAIVGETSKIKIEKKFDCYDLTYGLGDSLLKQLQEKTNQKLRITIESKSNQEAELVFDLDEENPTLLDAIEIRAEENTKATIILKYQSSQKVEGFHNGILKLFAKQGAKINIIVVNFMNETSHHFMSIENRIEKDAKVNYTIVDFGGKKNITNYYSNLIGDASENTLNTIYLGKENQLLDFNYIGELRGKKSNIKIEVQGALKDKAKKHFKGTIDFKKGCKKAKGDENESCMLLSDTAKSLALPMLLCSEEEVEGNHSTSAGKIGEKELFYMMSRGFTQKEAMQLMVRARFNKIIEKIQNENLKEEILNQIDQRLD